MLMTRKQAMLGCLLGLFSGASGQKLTPEGLVNMGESNDFMGFASMSAADIHRRVAFRVTFESHGDHGKEYMLEVRADGRVARFTEKEVMDALGGWFEPVKP